MEIRDGVALEDIKGEGKFEIVHMKQKEKRVIRKYATTWVSRNHPNRSGGRGGWQDLSVDQDKEKRFW